MKQKLFNLNLLWTILLFSPLYLFSPVIMAQEIPNQYREDYSVSWPNRKAQPLEIKDYADKLLNERIQKFLT